MTIEQAAAASGDDTSTRRRILAATTEVLARNGQDTKLSLSEVAAQAGVSRPTLYRWFASKEELLPTRSDSMSARCSTPG